MRHIRYSPPFPVVIPESRAGCSRVTHPFATDPPRRASPFDLHVLSTPPAFVLSQDQTLRECSLSRTQHARAAPRGGIIPGCTASSLCNRLPGKGKDFFKGTSSRNETGYQHIWR